MALPAWWVDSCFHQRFHLLIAFNAPLNHVNGFAPGSDGIIKDSLSGPSGAFHRL